MHRLHDAEIVGLALTPGADDFANELVLTVRAVDGARRLLRFRGAADWALSPFGTQNVVLNFYAYDRFTLTAPLIEFYAVPEPWAAAVRSGEYRLYALTASVGMEGLVLAQGLSIDEDA